MDTESYLMIENNVVINNVIWNGDVNIWQPPTNVIMLPLLTTPALVWRLQSDNINFALVEVMGAGDIGFTWNGNILTTNQLQPNPLTPITPST